VVKTTKNNVHTMAPLTKPHNTLAYQICMYFVEVAPKFLYMNGPAKKVHPIEYPKKDNF
jgi:hypothetical protein